MTRSQRWLSRASIALLIVVPLAVMGVLTIKVLFPNLNNPKSRVYSSSAGYPSQQRLAGKPIEVRTVVVESKTLEFSLAAPGESVALQEVDVRPEITGVIAEVLVAEGEQVRQGQPLVRIDPSDFEDRVSRDRNDLAIAEAQLQALEISSAARLRELENDVRSARARLEEAETRLEEIDALAEEQIKNRIEAAEVMVETAEKRLEESKFLARAGAIARFQLYDAEDTYAASRRELQDAQKGIFNDQNERFVNRDFYLTRQRELIEAREELELARETLDRELDKARLTVETRRIELEDAIRDLKRTVIYAGTEGLISNLNAHPGDFIDAQWGYQEPLIRLTEDIVFKAFVDQARLNEVEEGDPATVRLIAYPGQTFTGRVIKINPTVQTEEIRVTKVTVDRQYTYSVWIAVDDLDMPTGLQGYVELNKKKTGLVIPERAVTHLSGGEGMVMIVSEGEEKAVVKKVKLGRKFDNQREVLEGLKVGERVVLDPRALEPDDSLALEELEAETEGDRL